MSPTDLQLDALTAEGISLTPSFGAQGLRIEAAGEIGLRDPERLLDPYWTAVDQEAVRLGAATVVVDLRAVDFMNSSGILTLVRWISKVKATPGGRGYRIVLTYDRNVTWQKNSLPTVAKLAPGIVEAQAE